MCQSHRKFGVRKSSGYSCQIVAVARGLAKARVILLGVFHNGSETPAFPHEYAHLLVFFPINREKRGKLWK